MAIASVGSGGTGLSSTSTTSFTLTTATNTINAADNRFAILTIAKDNTGTADGNTSEITSVTGGSGTWSKLGEYTNGNGAAEAGVTTALWLFIPNGANAIGTVFTINLGVARVDKVASLWVFSHGAGQSVRLDPEPATNPLVSISDGATGFGSVSFSGLTSQERLYFRGCGKEANSTTQITPTTNFTAITLQRSRNNTLAMLVRGEFRIVTATSITSSPTLAVTGDTSCVFAALEEFAPPVTQNLTQATRFDNGQTFFGPTVAPGTVTLSQSSRFDNGNTFYAATIGQGTTVTQATRFDNANTFYAASLTRGTVALTQASRLDNTNTFYAVTLSRGAVALTQSSRLDNANTFYSPAIGGAAAITQTARFNNTNTFYATTVTQVGPTQSLLPAYYAGSNAFYSPVINSQATVLVNLAVNSAQFYSASVNSSINLSGQFTQNQNSFYSATVSTAGTSITLPEPISNTQEFYSAELIYSQFVSAPIISSGNTFYGVIVTNGAEQTSPGGFTKNRPFKPSKFIQHPEDKPESATAFVEALEMRPTLSGVWAVGETIIFGLAKVRTQIISSETFEIRAFSSWNDPTEDELAAIIECLV
jgi:hypothetical protein